MSSHVTHSDTQMKQATEGESEMEREKEKERERVGRERDSQLELDLCFDRQLISADIYLAGCADSSSCLFASQSWPFF